MEPESATRKKKNRHNHPHSPGEGAWEAIYVVWTIFWFSVLRQYYFCPDTSQLLWSYLMFCGVTGMHGNIQA